MNILYFGISVFFLFLWHLLQLRFQLHSTEMMMLRWANQSLLFRTMQAIVVGCVCQSWINKLFTYLLTYRCLFATQAEHKYKYRIKTSKNHKNKPTYNYGDAIEVIY